MRRLAGLVPARFARGGPWWIVFVLGAIVFLPAVRTSFLLDDYLHVAMVDGTFPAPRGVFDLYDFVSDDVRPAMFERGLLPWWAHPKLTIRFFRPLSSALLWLDHRVFSHAPLPMHLHSALWWIACVIAARALFRRTLPPRPATIATAIFALAPCHAMPLAWLANREALVSVALGLWALAAHARWRESATAGRAAIAAALFAAAFAGGGEYALALGGYVLAMEMVGDARRKQGRVVCMLPFVVPAVAYLAVRWRLGYGAFGSGFYTDPIRSPLAFLREVPWRAVALTGQGWLTIDTRSWESTPARVVLGAIVIASLVVTLVVARRAVKGRDEAVRRSAGWLTLGSLFAMVPALAVIPAPRVLGVSMIGVAGVVALVLDDAWFDEAGAPRRELVQTVAIALGFAHLVHGPASSWLWSTEFLGDAKRFGGNARALAANVGDPVDKEIGVVRGTVGMFFAPFALDARGRTPKRWTVLAETGHVLALRRGASSLELVAPAGRGLYPVTVGSLLRAPDAQLRTGDVVEVPGMRATVVDANVEFGPRDVLFAFDRDLGVAPAVWIDEKYFAWSDVALPAIGFGAPYDP